jgi:aminocarboxymuconate-semialdehyde decarboxylase
VNDGSTAFMRCHTCGHHGPGVDVGAAPATPRLPHATLDMHCHMLVPAVEAMVAAAPQKQAEPALQRRLLGDPSVEHNAAMRGALQARIISGAQRLADMDRLGIDVQVLSPSPTQYYGWADEALAERIVQAQNEALGEAVRQRPDRFVGLGAVALQHPELAARQLREAMREHGLLGAEITSDPTGRGLDDPALDMFWREAEQLGATLFLHPLGTSLGERVNRYYLSNIVGQPLETTVALSELIFGGVLDRHPRLRICAAHGGGYLPYAIGRSDHGFGVRPEARGCREAPSRYLGRLWYDTVVFRPESVRTLIDQVGLSQVVAGTDYPFDMGEYALHDLVRRVPGLDAPDQAAILGGNAATLLALPPTHPALISAHARASAIHASFS